MDAAAAEVQGRAPGEQRGAEHARGAADDAGAAVAALVRVAPARDEAVGEQGGRDQVAGGWVKLELRIGDRRSGVEAKVEAGNADFAAVVGAVSGVQAGLGADEAERVRGPDAGGEGAAGVGVKAARDVERQQRAGVAHGERVRGFDQRGVGAAWRPGESDAEQAVDDQVPARDGRDGGFAAAAGGNEAAIGRGGIGRQLLRRARKHHADLEMAGLQVLGDDEGVATVVAGAGEDEDAAAVGQGFGPGGGCGAGTRHQRVVGVRGFEDAQGRAAVERQGGGRHGG